uniref:Secreted protein n=1 Tax=Prorocentrum micans TaxID=2945 RepID=A0A7S2TBY2_PROMC
MSQNGYGARSTIRPLRNGMTVFFFFFFFSFSSTFAGTPKACEAERRSKVKVSERRLIKQGPIGINLAPGRTRRSPNATGSASHCTESALPQGACWHRREATRAAGRMAL